MRSSSAFKLAEMYADPVPKSNDAAQACGKNVAQSLLKKTTRK
jgi:hypothetical protein